MLIPFIQFMQSFIDPLGKIVVWSWWCWSTDTSAVNGVEPPTFCFTTASHSSQSSTSQQSAAAGCLVEVLLISNTGSLKIWGFSLKGFLNYILQFLIFSKATTTRFVQFGWLETAPFCASVRGVVQIQDDVCLEWVHPEVQAHKASRKEQNIS